MAKPLQIPFRSYHRLRKWRDDHYLKELPDSDYLNRQTQTYYEGMVHWFRVQNTPTIRVCSYDCDAQYADVQYELYIGDSSIQVYLMTLITPRAASESMEVAEDFGVEDLETGVKLPDVVDPFSRPTVIWETESIGPEEIVEAVRRWSAQFWPDFECEFQYDQIEDGISKRMLEGDFINWREFIELRDDSHCRVLLQCDPSLVLDIERWATERGCESVYVSQSYLVLLTGCPMKLLPELEQKFDAIDFVVAPPLDYT